MKKLFLSLPLLILSLLGYAQTVLDQPVDRMKTLDKSWGNYYFHVSKEHAQGVVFLKNGKQAAVALNYDMERQIMTFYKSDGTFSSIRPDDTRYVLLGSFMFYPTNETFGEVIAKDKGYELLASRKIRSQNRSTDAYGKVSATSSATNLTAAQYTVGPVTTAVTEPIVNPETVSFTRDDQFYIRYKDRVYTLNKRSIQKLFPNQSDVLMEYVKTERVSYSNYEDVYAFFKHCMSLLN